MSDDTKLDGELAARRGLLFDACPYTFEACGFDAARFDRKKLNAWWDGWAGHYMATIGYLPHKRTPPVAQPDVRAKE